MSLDKQKILNDLGSVMNQLQSAEWILLGLPRWCSASGMFTEARIDGFLAIMRKKIASYMDRDRKSPNSILKIIAGSGCMGNMFSKSGNAQNKGAPAYGCQQGWGNQAYGGRRCFREPYPTNQQSMPMQGNRCMNYCNPSKLYADTYGYLNQNLMQPVVREVYDDLKSINPANTVMNSPMGNQMGLGQGSQNVPKVRGNMGIVEGQNPMGGIPAGNAMTAMPMGQQQQNPMGGMGAQIVNMMMGSKSQAGQDGQQPSQGGNMNAQMGANQGQYAGNMQNISGYEAQPTDTMGATAAHYNTGNMGATQDQYNSGNMGGNKAQYSTGNLGAPMQNPTTQYMTQPNSMAGNMNQNQGMGNRPGQPMPAAQQGNHGMHSQGIAKFNEMFPGVMAGMEGNLDFDPMAIAMQMNPANKQDTTMKTMQKLMTENNRNRPLDANANAMKPVINGMNAVNANLNPNQAQPVPDNQVNQQMTPNQQQYAVSPQTPAYQQQQVVNPVLTEKPGYQEAPPQPVAEQIYHEQPPPRRSEKINLPEGGYPNQAPPGYMQLVKEPIFPVETSKAQDYQYNTLGQPIETFPVKSYHSAPPNLPQTLSPQPIHTRLRNEPTRYSNVKSTVSKTSLFGNRAGGKTPSRSQLQHVYNQYKGSHSYTNQNIRNPVQQQPGGSDGRLNVQQANPAAQPQIPVERVGGDTIANNQILQQVAKKGEQDINQLGDGAAKKPQGNADLNGKQRPMSPLRYANLRNGLQDIAFTSSPRSTAWSFHGVSQSRRKVF